MKINGYEKFSMVDFEGKIACTVFTGGCNLRCPFCHNGSLVIGDVKANQIDDGEVMEYLEKRRGLVDAVSVTGGEATLQPDLADFLRRVRALGYITKLDTNGLRPDVLKSLLDEGLVDYVAMDIKNSRESYGRTVGIEGYDVGKVQKSVEYLLGGAVPYEFCTTVVLEYHRRSDFESIGRWIAGAERYYLQRFICSEGVMREGLHRYNDSIMEQALEIVKRDVPAARLRGW